MKSKPYLLQISLFTTFVAALVGISCLLVPNWVTIYTWFTILFMYACTILVHFITRKGIQGDAYDMQNYFMAGSFLKIILCGLVLFLYMYFIKENKIPFTLYFFAIYFMFTFFEIKSLLLSLQPLKGENKKE